MSRSKFPMAIAIAIAAVFAAATATAATPQHGDYIDKAKNGRTVIDLNVFDNLKAMQPNFFNKCADVPVRYDVKIKPSGRFSFDGSATDIQGTRLSISIAGKFVSAKRATGTVDYDAGGCKGKPVDFDARFVGVISKASCGKLLHRYYEAADHSNGAKAKRIRQKMVNKGCQNLPPPATPVG